MVSCNKGSLINMNDKVGENYDSWVTQTVS